MLCVRTGKVLTPSGNKLGPSTSGPNLEMRCTVSQKSELRTQTRIFQERAHFLDSSIIGRYDVTLQSTSLNKPHLERRLPGPCVQLWQHEISPFSPPFPPLQKNLLVSVIRPNPAAYCRHASETRSGPGDPGTLQQNDGLFLEELTKFPNLHLSALFLYFLGAPQRLLPYICAANNRRCGRAEGLGVLFLSHSALALALGIRNIRNH